MMTYKNLYCALVRSMSEAIACTMKEKSFLLAKRCTKLFWTQKTKSSPTTSSPTNPSAVPPQLKTKKRGERSNAAPAGSLPPCCRHTRLTIVRRGCNR